MWTQEYTANTTSTSPEIIGTACKSIIIVGILSASTEMGCWFEEERGKIENYKDLVGIGTPSQ